MVRLSHLGRGIKPWQVQMDKEDLYVSAREIRVDYVMTNTTSKDIEVDVLFPLPDIVISEEFDSARGMVDLARDLKFETKVNGKLFPRLLKSSARFA